ncbi:MAG: RICIN domain-containing protein [Pedobacter sp.]
MRKSLLLFALPFLACFLSTEFSSAQIARINSGAIYTIKSRANNKLLTVSNSSMDNSAIVNSWTDTQSDAQRWIIKHLGKGVYTFQNVASGKMLHVSSHTEESVKIDQYENDNGDAIKWVIKSAGSGTYYFKPVTKSKYSLNLQGAEEADGTTVNLAQSSTESVQKWVLQKDRLPAKLTRRKLLIKPLKLGFYIIKWKVVKDFGIVQR